jgi:hypothetical protein
MYICTNRIRELKLLQKYVIIWDKLNRYRNKKIEWHFLRQSFFFSTQKRQLLYVCAARKKARRGVVNGTALTACRKQSWQCIK